jgi:hypothetical protein
MRPQIIYIVLKPPQNFYNGAINNCCPLTSGGGSGFLTPYNDEVARARQTKPTPSLSQRRTGSARRMIDNHEGVGEGVGGW